MLNILHEDAGLLVVNKPAGLVCHPTKGDELSSLISRARLYLKPSTLNPQPSTHLINRLDRETSGVVLIAKNSATAGELGKIFEARAAQKEYLAIVHGHVREDHGLIDVPLGKDECSIVAVKDCVRPDGTPAQTEFFVERRFVRSSDMTIEEWQKVGGTFSLSARATGGEGQIPRPRERERVAEGHVGVEGEPQFVAGEVGLVGLSTLNPQLSTHSLLRVIPHTGRKHQIRIHLAHLGHPIVGDKLYGGDEDLYLALVQDRLTPEQRARLILPHQALHASALRFARRGRSMEFSCAPEPWFSEFAAAGQ